MLQAIEWSGSLLGMFGALLLAINNQVSGVRSFHIGQVITKVLNRFCKQSLEFNRLRFSLYVPAAKYGWIFFAASNVCWIYFGFITEAWGLVTQQIVFTATSIIGIYQWIINQPDPNEPPFV